MKFTVARARQRLKYIASIKPDIGRWLYSNGPIKLNVGCGTDYKLGWVNIDNNSDDNIDQLDLNWDLRDPLPFPDGSVDFVFNEHFLEHLTVDEGQVVIKDLMRVLKPGGILRMSMPNLEEAVRRYGDPKWKEDSFIKDFDLDFVQTPAEMLNMTFSWWGHKWVYDWEELARRLEEAGCKQYQRCQPGMSEVVELRGLETRHKSDLVVEVMK